MDKDKTLRERGKRIVIKYSELVFEDGTINQDNLGTAERTHNMQTDIYILKVMVRRSMSPDLPIMVLGMYRLRVLMRSQILKTL